MSLRRPQLPRPLVSDRQPDLPYAQLAASAVRDVTRSIESAGARTVIVTSMLTTIEDPLGCLSAARDVSECETVQKVSPDDPNAFYLAAAAADPDVATIDVNTVMCPGFPLCAAVLDGLPTWRDDKHYLPANVVAHDAQIWDLLDSYYLTAAAESAHVATIDVNRIMCPGYPLCASVLDGLPVWRDDLHYLPSNVVAHDRRIWDQLTDTGFFSR